MATKLELDEAWGETRIALLRKIKEAVDQNWASGNIREMAEAYAWVTRPDQGHGT